MLADVRGVSKSFGVDVILEDITFRIDRRDRIALVGRNGCGKTTLLRILSGIDTPDRGTVVFARGIRIGTLRQEGQVERGRTVLQEAESARAHQVKLRRRLEELEAKMDSGTTNEELDEYAALHEHFVELEGYRAESDVRVVLRKMGFSEEEFDKPVEKLSGGEQTRLALARLILDEPDLLILDEPTNHLDLQATEWLEGWLRSYPGAILVVSHDRTFLESGFDRFLELRNCRLHAYPGPLAKYLKVKAEEADRIAEVARRQQEAIDKLDEYVRRFMGTQRTAQARGRLKMMERLKAGQVVVERGDRTMAAGYQASKRSGDVVIECRDLSKSYESKLFSNLNWTVRIGERWGVIGENGAGKSTLIKCALGLVVPDGGTAKLGRNVEVGYFAQDVVELDPAQSPLDHLVYNFDLKPPQARNLLGRFLITGDDVFRPIKTLSGGEKNKLVLASLTTLNPNLLILDEPTNHLDMDSREALAEVLREYRSTLVLVSHDRWLLDQVCDHILDVRRDRVVQFPGGYADYRRPKPAPRFEVKPVEFSFRPRPALSPRELSKAITKARQSVADSESAIQRLEQELQDNEGLLAAIPSPEDILRLTREHERIRLEIEGLYARWQAETEELESLEAAQGT